MSIFLFKCKAKQCLHFGVEMGVKTMSIFWGPCVNQTAILTAYLTLLQTKHSLTILFSWTSVSTFLWLSFCKIKRWLASFDSHASKQTAIYFMWNPYCKPNVCRTFFFKSHGNQIWSIFLWFSSNQMYVDHSCTSWKLKICLPLFDSRPVKQNAWWAYLSPGNTMHVSIILNSRPSKIISTSLFNGMIEFGILMTGKWFKWRKTNQTNTNYNHCSSIFLFILFLFFLYWKMKHY